MNRFLVAAVALIAAVLLLVASVVFFMAREPLPPAELAELGRLETDGVAVTQLLPLPDGKHVVGMAEDGTFRTWNLDESQVVYRSTEKIPPQGAVGLIDGRLLTVVQRSGQGADRFPDWYADRINPLDGRQDASARLELVEDKVRFAVPRDASRSVVVGVGPKRLYVWDADTGKQVSAFDLPIGEGSTAPPSFHEICLTANGRWALVASGGELTLWDMGIGTMFRVLGAGLEIGTPRALQFSPYEDLALSVSDDAVRVWDVETGRLVSRFDARGASPRCAAFSPDDRRTASGGTGQTPQGGESGIVYVWDCRSGGELGHYFGPAGEVESLAFSSDGKSLLAGYTGGELVLIDLAGTESR